jgi:ferredoxin
VAGEVTGEVSVADGNSVRATIDERKCSGYGICAELCPEVFKLDDEGFAHVEGPVPEEHLEAAREAEHECPEEAITVEPADG